MFRRFFLSAALLSQAAMAAPLLTKSSATGTNTKPENYKSQTCGVYSDKVTVTSSYGLADGSKVSTSHDVAISLSSNFQDLITAAENDKAETTAVTDCGYPETIVTTADGTILYDTGTCDRPHIYRGLGATTSVLDFLNSFCAKTY